MNHVIASQPYVNPAPVAIDLVALIRHALPQVYGADERQLLADFLQRNTSDQIVSVPLAQCLRANNQQSVHPARAEPCSRSQP